MRFAQSRQLNPPFFASFVRSFLSLSFVFSSISGLCEVRHGKIRNEEWNVDSSKNAEEQRRKKKFERKYSKHFSWFRCVQQRIRTISRFVSFQLYVFISIFSCFAVFHKTKALPKTHTHTYIAQPPDTHLPSSTTTYIRPNHAERKRNEATNKR